jgi:excisionase family DNA binding protein
MNETGGGKETYMTIEEVAAYLRLAEQTIRRWVLNREMPYHKIRKVIRFQLSEIEKWIDGSGGDCPGLPADDLTGDLFAGVEGGAGESRIGAETDNTGADEAGGGTE